MSGDQPELTFAQASEALNRVIAQNTAFAQMQRILAAATNAEQMISALETRRADLTSEGENLSQENKQAEARAISLAEGYRQKNTELDATYQVKSRNLESDHAARVEKVNKDFDVGSAELNREIDELTKTRDDLTAEITAGQATLKRLNDETAAYRRRIEANL